MRSLLLGLASFALLDAASAQRQMENLSRGVVVAATEDGDHLVSWRLFGTDPESIAFNLYRQSAGNPPERLTETPLTSATNYVVHRGSELVGAQYFVRPIVDGLEGEASSSAGVWQGGFLEIPIQPIDEYRPGDASVADLDGDGEYEIVLQQSARTHDNAHSGLTGRPVLDAYELDGTHLWRIDLGHNIRDGEHYTQFMVYDLDGDGKAEVACKTADGSTDGQGNTIGDATKDWRTKDERSRAFGRVLDGPEFLTIFDGHSGKALKTVDYVPNRDPIDGWGGIGGNGGNDSLRQSLRSLSGLRRLPRRRSPKPRHVPRRLRSYGRRGVGLAWRRADATVGVRFRHQLSAVPRRFALLGDGWPFAVGRRRR